MVEPRHDVIDLPGRQIQVADMPPQLDGNVAILLHDGQEHARDDGVDSQSASQQNSSSGYCLGTDHPQVAQQEQVFIIGQIGHPMQCMLLVAKLADSALPSIHGKEPPVFRVRVSRGSFH